MKQYRLNNCLVMRYHKSITDTLDTVKRFVCANEQRKGHFEKSELGVCALLSGRSGFPPPPPHPPPPRFKTLRRLSIFICFFFFVAEKKKTNNQCANTKVNCLSFFPIELCQGTIRDQNYYAVCRSVLADIGSRRGLLHSPPEENDFKVMLHDALTECVEAKKIRRTEAIELVMGLLQSKINQASGK